MDLQNPKKNIITSSHPIKNILDSSNSVLFFLKILFLILMASMGLFALYSATESLITPIVYKKDFIQDYLLGQALLNGVDPYLSISQLAQQFIGDLPNTIYQHASPHPPFVAIISLPFSLLSFEHASIAWFLFEIICIFFGIYLITYKILNKHSLKLSILFFFLVMALDPFHAELILGQLTALLFVMLVCAWVNIGSGKNKLGGVFIGLLIAIKLMAWPIIIFLIIRKNWTAVVAAGITIITSNVIAGLIIGFDKIIYYYFKVSTIVSPLYRAHEANFSVWSIGWRLFEGTGSPVLLGLEAPPMVDIPFLAPFVSVSLTLLLLFISLRLALRAHNFDTSFAIMVCVSTIVNPVAWAPYLMLTLIPIIIVSRDLFIQDMPQKQTWWLILLLIVLFIPRQEIRLLILKLTDIEATTIRPQVPFIATLLTIIPTISVISLLLLASDMDRFYKKNGS